MKNKEINIFIENAYESFVQEKVDLAKITQDAKDMVSYFLDNQSWVKNSCLKEYDYDLLYFDVVFCNDEKIHEINKEYRQKDSSTDVITFAIFADSPKEERFIFDNEINLGEVIISLDHAYTQSKEGQHEKSNFEDELYFLIAHGILHLLGYDHTDEKTLQEMWDVQHKMINKQKVI